MPGGTTDGWCRVSETLLGIASIYRYNIPVSTIDGRYSMSETYWGYHLYTGITCMEVQQMGYIWS